MSMLRFVLRKINVIHNSLTKFWYVRKSNEGASLSQSIAQTKAKLQLDEAGGLLNWLVWVIFLWLLLWPLVSVIFSFVSGQSFLGSLLPSVPISIGVSITIKIAPIILPIMAKSYSERLRVFATISFSHNRGSGKVEFSCDRDTYDNSSIAKKIENLTKNTISLTGGNSNTDVVQEICHNVDPKLYNNFHFSPQRGNNIKVKFLNETYICSVMWN